MKRIAYTLGLSLALAGFAPAQETTGPQTGTQPTVENPETGGKPAAPGDSTVGQSRYADAMKNLPAGVLDKINAARTAADQAKLDLERMRTEGKSAEEVEAMIAEKKAAALSNLQNALDALDNVPEAAKDRVGMAKEVISKRLADRKAEMPAEVENP